MKECESTHMVPWECGKFSQCSLPCARNKELRWEGRAQVGAPHSGEEAQQVAGGAGVELPRESSTCHLRRVTVESQRGNGVWVELGDHFPSRVRGEKGELNKEQAAVGGGTLRVQCLKVLGACCR